MSALLTQISPSSAAALRRCPMKVALARRAATRWLSRPTAASSLGVVAHAVTARATEGKLAVATHNEPCALRATWDEEAARAHQKLAAAWSPAEVPLPATWPGHALTRARLMAALSSAGAVVKPSVADLGGRKAPAAGDLSPQAPAALPWVEQALSDPNSPLVGTPDRVEQLEGHLTVVDLKSGVHHDGATEEQVRQLLLYAHLVRAQGLPLPTLGVVLAASGKEDHVALDETAVQAAVDESLQLLSDFNAAGGINVDHPVVAEAARCRGCAFRPACRSFLSAWSDEWQVGRGAHGTLVDQGSMSTGWVAVIDARAPVEASGRRVRVSNLPAALDAEPGDDVAIVRTDTFGSGDALGARWDSLVWPGFRRASDPTPA